MNSQLHSACEQQANHEAGRGALVMQAESNNLSEVVFG